MRCEYFETGLCRSCTLLATPYSAQLAAKNARVQAALADVCDVGGASGFGAVQRGDGAQPGGDAQPGDDDGPASALSGDAQPGDDPQPRPTSVSWLPPAASPESGFRNKAKLAVGGSVESPSLGILDGQFNGVDLAECPLYEPALAAAFPALREFVTRAGLEPYRPAEDRGELKNILVTAAPSGALMVRFVLRSTESIPRISKHLDWLLAHLPEPAARHVVSVNLLPERAALTEGGEETVLTEREHLEMDLGEVTLLLRPGSFFQTNTAIARALYGQAREWVEDLVAQGEFAGSPAGSATLHIWDLYCGAGGFALALAGTGREVLGVEISEEAVESARAAASAAGSQARFVVGDAEASAYAHPKPELIVVNPPRRGIGGLAEWIEASGAAHVIYSSCNPATLAADIAAMPSYRLAAGRIFDMFPHTDHVETLVLLERRN